MVLQIFAKIEMTRNEKKYIYLAAILKRYIFSLKYGDEC